MKALLSNFAKTAARHDPEQKAYFQRNLNEGKAKITVLNAIRAKLINRVFAVVNRETEHMEIRKYDLAA